MAASAALESRIRRYFVFQILWSFELWHPFWTLWLLQNLRGDFFAATLVDVVFWVVGLLFAMPAGALADRYGRKPALVVGIVLWNVGIVLFGLAGSLPAFALANAAWAFGAAFMFSCGSAYLYDRRDGHAEFSSRPPAERRDRHGGHRRRPDVPRAGGAPPSRREFVRADPHRPANHAR